MRSLLAAIVTVGAIAGPASAQSTSVKQFVQEGASVSAFGSDADGSYQFNAWATTRRGADGLSEAYVYFSLGARVGPDGWEYISGSGYVPGSALKVTGGAIRVELADLTRVPDYSLTAGRCDMFNCYEIPLPDTFPVDVVASPTGRHSEQRQGVMRRHSEFDWMANASVDVVEVGSSVTVTAAADGLLGPRQLRSSTSSMFDCWIGQSRGSTITIERTSTP
jgi:hypothetical protein